MHAKNRAFAALLLGMLMAQLDTTVVVAALPALQADLAAGTAVAGVTTAYLVTVTFATLVLGRLGDRHGRRAVFTGSVLVFAAASAACAAAPDIATLVAARAVQGIGGSGLVVTAMSALGEMFDRDQLIRRAGWQTAVFALASVGGPPLGALLVAGPGWRWIFLLNLPLCLIALAIGFRGLPTGTGRTPPLRPAVRAMFSDRTTRRAVVVTALSGLALFGTFTYVSLAVALIGATSALLTAMTAGQLVTSASFAAWARRWPDLPAWGRLGCASGAVGLVLLALAPHAGVAVLVPGLFLAGAAFGLTASAYTLLVQTTAAKEVLGASMGVLAFARQAGGVVGTAGLGAVAVLCTGGFGSPGLTIAFACAALAMAVALAVTPREAVDLKTSNTAR
ncbi:MFS transporter [Amycolatopsis tucumanensis]|uniref:MFS transporter n=1 Tax=Amycolatopsis tucumanensis TaxID=401106 RepID=UPI003D762EFD